MVNYRAVTAPADMERVVDLEIAIWGVCERDAFAPHLMCLLPMNGGAVLVAEDSDAFVGFCASTPALRDGKHILWSFMAGVHPGYQGRGIGYALKHYQRQWASENGYERIHWTFDPLKNRNANFNLNMLGVVGYRYHHNLYGQMVDAINVHPLPSDRLEVYWNVNAEARDAHAAIPEDVTMLVAPSPDGPEARLPGNLPPHIGICSPPAGTPDLEAWQDEMRRAFLHAFANDFKVRRYVYNGAPGYYLLHREA